MKYLLLCASLLLCTGCVGEEFPELEEVAENIFSAGGPDLFLLTNVEVFNQVNNLRRVVIDFEAEIDGIPQMQRDLITGILVVGRTTISPDRRQIVLTGVMSGTEFCVELAFTTQTGEQSRKTELCFPVD